VLPLVPVLPPVPALPPLVPPLPVPPLPDPPVVVGGTVSSAQLAAPNETSVTATAPKERSARRRADSRDGA
jgi:hypothetical protein